MGFLAELQSLKGRTALITGANGHIGSVICKTLAELGADLVVTDMPGNDYTKLLDTIREIDPSVYVVAIDCDLESEQDREALIRSVKGDWQSLEILVNNAAFVGTRDLEGWVTDFEEQSLDTWRRAIEVNLSAVFHFTRDLAPMMSSSGKGSIINIGSIYAKYAPDFTLYEETGMGNAAAYAASKAGVLQFTRWVATQLAPFVRANSISPGGVFRHQPDAFVRRYTDQVPLGRMAVESDFCGVIAYLASDMSAYVTGQDIAVDGGWGIL